MHCLAQKIPYVKDRRLANYLIKESNRFISDINQKEIFNEDLSEMARVQS
jgi:hypothetical protein